VLFRVSDYEVHAADLAQAIAAASGNAWIGGAQAAHTNLVQRAQAAVRMSLIAALRRWGRGATIEGQTVHDASASLEVLAQHDSAVTLTGRLGGEVLFRVRAPLALAPAYACRAVESLDRGQILEAPEELAAVREAQEAFCAAFGLASVETCSACVGVES
jgi:hypothetical protein